MFFRCWQFLSFLNRWILQQFEKALEIIRLNIFGFVVHKMQAIPAHEVTLTGISVILLIIFAFSVCSEDKVGGDRIVGGECQYKQYQGRAEVVSITPIGRPAGYSSDRYEVRFRFTPDQKIEEPFAQTEGREFLLLLNHNYYPGLDFLEKYDIKVGKVLDCTLKVIVRGTCTPMLFDFAFKTPEKMKGN